MVRENEGQTSRFATVYILKKWRTLATRNLGIRVGVARRIENRCKGTRDRFDERSSREIDLIEEASTRHGLTVSQESGSVAKLLSFILLDLL